MVIEVLEKECKAESLRAQRGRASLPSASAVDLLIHNLAAGSETAKILSFHYPRFQLLFPADGISRLHTYTQ
jgi:hypothetical protein